MPAIELEPEGSEALMYCNGCGQALLAGQGFCPRCGLVSGMGMPMAGMPRSWLPLGLVERRINALAVGWLVYAGLIAATGFLGLAFAHAFLSGHLGAFGYDPRVWGGHGLGHRIGIGPLMPLFFLKFAWMAMVVRVGLALAAGLGLMQKSTWGRWVAIVAGCLALIHLPFGTALGIWTLMVLLSAPNAAGYEAMARG
jgi:hypothetical protein